MQHVVEVDPDARFEFGQEVVLTDAADEGGHRVAEGGLGRPQRRVGHRETYFVRAGEATLLDLDGS